MLGEDGQAPWAGPQSITEEQLGQHPPSDAFKSLYDISTEKDKLTHRCHIIFEFLSGTLQNRDLKKNYNVHFKYFQRSSLNKSF